MRPPTGAALYHAQGRCKGAVEAGESITSVAGRLGFDPDTVRKYAKADGPISRKVWRAKSLAPIIKRRRALVRTLACTVKTLGPRKIPAFPSPQAIAAELKRTTE